jgi:hypothetical protein
VSFEENCSSDKRGWLMEKHLAWEVLEVVIMGQLETVKNCVVSCSVSGDGITFQKKQSM